MPRNSILNLFFGGILLVISLYFIIWGFDYIGEANKIIFTISVILGIFMAFNVGGNDVSNSFGTSVGAGTLTITQALCIAAIFEVDGAVIAGGEVTATIRSGIVDLQKMSVSPFDFVYIMMSALLAAGLWLLIATKKGMPVSTTHAIVGGIVGASLTLGVILEHSEISPLSILRWNKLFEIVLSWIISPVLGGITSYMIYRVIKKYIINYNAIAQIKIDRIKRKKKELKKEHKKIYETLNDLQKVAYSEILNKDLLEMQEHNLNYKHLSSDYYKKINELDMQKEKLQSHKALELGIPIIAAFGTIVLVGMLLFKGLKNLNLGLSAFQNYLIISMCATIVWAAMFVFAKNLRRSDLSKSTFLMFSWLQVFTACGFAFSHGSNDISNAVGPFAAIIDTLATGAVNGEAAIPPIVMITFGIALVAGLWFIGREVIQTVGTNLTKMHPASGFSAELSAASIVMLATVFGIPVSSTHILIGAVLGIGLVNKAANWSLMKPIVLAWIITIPVAAVISSISLLVFRNIF